MNNPLVSVCIPTYKNPEAFTKCLDSIVSQTYENIEIIITDDSPNEEIADIVKKYESQNSILYKRNSKALGSPENWNEGLRLANGEFIKIMHHDDWFTDASALKKYVETAKKTNADFIVASCNNVSATQTKAHRINKRFRYKWSQNPSLILYANYLGNPSTTFIRRPKDYTPTFDRNSLWYVDVIFYYDFTQAHPRVVYIEDILVDTSAGLETQVTNSAISKKIGIGEFIYVAEKYNLYKKNPFLTKLSIIEILKRYQVSSRQEMEQILQCSYDKNLPFLLLKLPIHHQVYNILKHFIILF